MRIHSTMCLAAASLLACAPASDERRICQKEMAFDDPQAREMFPVKPGEKELAECVETFAGMREALKLDDAHYAAYVRCRDAAKTMRESIDCAIKADAKTQVADPEVVAREAAAEKVKKAGDTALARLEGLVAGGAIDAATIAAVRERRASAPPERFAAIIKDAAALIEGGRIAPGAKLAIQLPPLAELKMTRPGSMGAELLFVEATTSRTVARVAPISKGQFGTKNGDIAELLKWAGEDSDRRDLEFEVVSTEPAGTAAVAPPNAFAKGLDALTEGGLDERPMIRVDGRAMTAGEWLKSQ